jgi:hypothetical protein
MVGTRPSLATGCSGRDRGIITGRLLVVDGNTVYGYGRRNVHWSNQLQDGPYRLFAAQRGEKAPRWAKPLPIQARALVLAGTILFAAGPRAGPGGPHELKGTGEESLLMAFAASDGAELARYELTAVPVHDGMAAARGRLYLSLENGQIVCMDKQDG